MPTNAGVGRSLAENSFESGSLAAREAVGSVPGGRVNLAIVFGTAWHDQSELIRGVRSEIGDASLIGCSGEGVISHDHSDERDHAVAVMAIQSDQLDFGTVLLGEFDSAPAAVGKRLAGWVRESDRGDTIGVLVFPDGLTGNCTEFLDAFGAELPKPLAVAGGTSADAMSFERTYQYHGDEVASNSVVALLIRGRGEMESAVSHGCSPIGLERVVTRAEKGWVHEIDGRPAWTVFKEYLEGDPEDLNAEGIVHLCIGTPLEHSADDTYEPYVIRTPLALDKDNGALFFPGGGFDAGQAIRLTRRDPERIREGARGCARRILEMRPGKLPSFVLQFDCAGRGRVLFGSCAADEIVRPLRLALGGTTPWIGFHTYGEIAPVAGDLYYHNYSVVLCAIYDLD